MDLKAQLERCAEFLSSCPNPQKVVFHSAAKARKRARQIGGMRSYQCVCGKWHLTTKVPVIDEMLENYDPDLFGEH